MIFSVSLCGGSVLKKYIKSYIEDSINTKKLILEDEKIISKIEEISKIIIDAYKKDNKVITAGNGGSAADAQHIAAELVSKFLIERPPINAVALTTNTSVLTAIGNDYNNDFIFSRQVEAFGRKGDVFIAISTSGNSTNIINAIKEAKKQGIITVGFTGKKDCLMDELCDYIIKVPSDFTPVIQESHIMIGHIICALVEKE